MLSAFRLMREAAFGSDSGLSERILQEHIRLLSAFCFMLYAFNLISVAIPKQLKLFYCKNLAVLQFSILKQKRSKYLCQVY